MKDIKYFIFRQNIKHYTKNRYIIYFLNFIELVMIYVPLMNICFYISAYKTGKKKTKNYFLIFSPYYYLHELYQISPYVGYSLMAFVTFLFIVFETLFFLEYEFQNHAINDFYINLYNAFFCRSFAICSIDVYIYNFISLTYNKDKSIIFSVMCLILLVVIIYFISDNIFNLYVISTGNINYHINITMRNADIYLFFLKILLAFCRNISEFSEDTDDSILFFLNVISLIYFYVGIVYFLIMIYFRPIYSIITKNNLQLRIFFNIFSAYMIFFTIFIHDENLFMYLILTIGTIFLSFVLAFEYNPIDLSLKQLNFLNYQDQILLILNLMQTKNKELYLKIYNEKIKFHYLFCRKCVFCNYLQKFRTENPKDNFDFNTLHKLFLKLIEKENKKLGQKEQNCIHDIYELLSDLKENSCYNLKTHYQFKKLIKRYNIIDKNFQNNLRIIYEDFCSEMKISESIKWRQVTLLDLILREIKDILICIEEKIQIYSVITPSEITKLSEKFSKMETDQTFFLNERDNMQYYGLVIMRILNEEILNIPINKDEGLIRVNKNYNEDFLNYHYNEDKVLIIDINLFNKKYIINHSGKDLLRFLGKDFSNLFPEEFRGYAMKKFLTEVNKNSMRKTFEFIIKGNEKNENIYYPFVYNFYFTLGIGNNDFCIIGEYNVIQHNLVITETQKNNQGEFDVIYYMAKEMALTLSPGHGIEKKQDKGIFRSSLILSNLFKKISDKKYSIIKKNKRYILNLFLIFSCEEKTYKVFNCQQKNYVYSNTKDIMELEDDEDDKKNHEEKKKSPKKYVVDDSRSVNTTSTVSVLTKKIILNKKTSGFIVGNSEILKKYQSRFQNTKKLMIYFSLFLVLFNVICLIIELKQNSKIISMNNIYTNLRSANRMYYILIASLMSVACFGDVDVINYSCKNFYEEYSLQQKTSLNYSFSVFDYIIHENKCKLNEIIERVKTLKKDIYKLTDKTTTDAYNQKFVYKAISIINNEIKIIEQETSFNNGIEIIINAVNIVLEDEEYFRRPIYFFYGIPYYNFSNLRYLNNMTDSQIQFYNIIINYINYLKTWNNIQYSMFSNIYSKINRFDKISNYFMISSFLLHIWLGFLLLYYLYSFLNLFILRIDKVIRKLKKEKNKEFFKKKSKLT